MDKSNKLGNFCEQLSKAVDTLNSHPHDGFSDSNDLNGGPAQGWSPEATTAKRQILSLISQIECTLKGPKEFIQGLTRQYHLLSCLQWLLEFHVLAYIPPSDSVQIKDIADLVGVSEVGLSRIVRVVAAAGFLAEPQPGFMAHTALSTPFVSNVSYIDAVNFLARTVAPAGSHMAAPTLQNGSKKAVNGDKQHANSATPNGASTFLADCEQQPKLLRQYEAYLRCINDMKLENDSGDIVQLLLQLDWHALGNARVVMANATTTEIADALSVKYPTLRVIAQTANAEAKAFAETERCGNTTVSVELRAPGSPQAVEDAAVYILQAPQLLQSGLQPGDGVLDSQVQAELQAHIGVLRSNPSATLILTPRVHPEAGSVEADVEEFALLRDISRMQLMNKRDWDVKELIDSLNNIQDETGRLVVVNQLTLRNTTMMALGIKYQKHI